MAVISPARLDVAPLFAAMKLSPSAVCDDLVQRAPGHDQRCAVRLTGELMSCSGALVVDPHASLRGVLLVVLPRFGLCVETTSTAQSAVNILAERPAEAVVVDEALLLDDSDMRLRRGTDRLIVTVAEPGSPRTRDARASGADACLRRPYAIGALLSLLPRPQDGCRRQ